MFYWNKLILSIFLGSLLWVSYADAQTVMNSNPTGNEQGMVTRNIPSGTQPVSGPLTDAQIRATPLPVSGTVTVTDGAGALNVIVDSGSVSISGSVPVTGPLTDTQLRATPIPVSGTVTVTDGAGSLNVIVDSGSVTVSGTVSATQSGTWTVQPGNTANTTPWLMTISQGSLSATVRDTGTSDSLNVAIVDASGNQITTFGGGAQYTEGDVDATITGTAMMGEVATNTLQPVQLNANKQLIVDLGTRLDQTNDAVSVYGSDDAGTTKRIIKTDSGGAVQVDVESGTITANQGGTWNINNVSGTVSLPTGAATSALQDGIIKDGTGDTTQANVSGGRVHVDGSGVTQPVSGSVSITQGGNTAAVNASSQLSVNCANCTGSGVSQQDKTGFTAGTSNMVPIGGYMDDTTPSTLAEGEAGAARMTTNRAVHVNLRDASGTELSVGGGTQYDQGTATTATDKLTMAGAIRRDTAALDAGVANGDRAALSTDSSGRLRVTSIDVQQPVSNSTASNSGSITAVAQQVILNNLGQGFLSAASIKVSGTWSGTLQFEYDDAALGAFVALPVHTGTTVVTSTTTNGDFIVNLPVTDIIQLRSSAWTSGTANIAFLAGNSVAGVTYPLPPGTNTLGGVNLSQYTPASGRLPVDGSGVTQPISAASLPLPTGAATAANQDGIIRDGTGDTTQANVSGGALHVAQQGNITVNSHDVTNAGTFATQIVQGGLTATVRDTGTSDSLNVAIVDGSGNHITSFGGGVQYTEGDTDTTITGTAIMFESNTGTSALSVASNTTPLPTRISDGTDQVNVTASGELSVNCGNCSGSGAVHTDDATFTGATDDVAPAGFLYDTSPPTITDGRAGIARMNANRQIYVDLATRLDPTNDEVKVSGTAADGAAVSGNPIRIGGKDGSGNTQDIATDTAGIVSVNVQNTPTVTIQDGGNVIDVQGTVTVTGTVTANAGTDLTTVNLLTTAAHNDAFGTAGSPDTQVRSVQGVTGMTPIVISGANANPKINCTNNAFLNMTSATTTEIVALSGSTIIYVCSFSIVSNGGTATNVKFVDGTGTNCATSQSDRSANMPFTAAANTVGISRGSGEGMILKTSTAGDALCVTSSGAATIAVDISYAQF